MTVFYYVYILTDKETKTHFYVGSTENLQSRLAKHNKAHISKFRSRKADICFASEIKDF